jgi:putative drug exporter of the RND superfamily
VALSATDTLPLMFAALGRFVTRFPWYVVGAWVLLAVVVVSLAPGLSSTQDESEFLPEHYESIRAAQVQEDEFPSQTDPGAILVFDRVDGSPLTAADSATVTEVVQALDATIKDEKVLSKFFAGAAAQDPSDNKLVQIGVAGLARDATGFDTAATEAAKELRAVAKPLVADTDLRLQMTGAAPQQLDSQESGDKTLAIVGAATIILIIVLLALIFRSIIICLMPVVLVGLAGTIATGLIGWANDIFDLKADSSIEVILFVVLYGIGTDYILFFLFRYREALRTGVDTKAAVVRSLERAGEAIASAGGAVIVSFLALVLSSLGIFRSIGPALAIAVAVTLLAALTLVPAVVTLLGRALFFPSKKYLQEPEGARFAAVGASLGRRPAVFAAASGLVLAVLAIFAIGFNPTFDFTSSLPKDVESTKAMDTLQKGLPPGSTDPVTVMLSSDRTLTESELADFAQSLSEAKGAARVAPGVLSESGEAAAFSVVLDRDPGSDASIANVKGPIRTAAHEAAPDGAIAYVGGTTSVFVDMQKAMKRDYSVVFPVAAVVIMLILALLLRSLVAPWYLMASVGLGFGATLGATVLVIQNIKGDSGLIFLLPIYIYLFVVALGTDYNILMIARLREEAREGRPPHEAAAQAVRHAGPTIAAAGVILAGTFASLMLGGDSLIISMGFALSFGIFIAAFVMSMFFTPALTALIGHAAWWPGHGDETAEEHEARVGHG